MPRDERDQAYLDELNLFIDDLNAGRVPRAHPRDDEEAQLLAMARQIRAASADDRPEPGFVHRLLGLLDDRRTARQAGRRWLLGSIASTVAATAAAFVAGIGIERYAERLWHAKPLIGAQGAWYRVASVAEAPVGSPRFFVAGAVQGYLTNDGGGVYARSAICTHMGCLLGWDGKRASFVCPCHGATFDRSCVSNDGRDHPNLPEIQVREAGGDIFA